MIGEKGAVLGFRYHTCPSFERSNIAEKYSLVKYIIG